jgi:hypothetical protein
MLPGSGANLPRIGVQLDAGTCQGVGFASKTKFSQTATLRPPLDSRLSD